MTNRKSYMRFRMVSKSSTLDDPEWPWRAKTHSVAEKMRLLEPAAQIWTKIDPYYQRQKCRPMILVSGNIRYMGIFMEVPLSGGVKWECGYRRRQFLAIWVATSSESTEIRPAILYSDKLHLVGRKLIAKWITLNDLEGLFDVRIRFGPAVCSRNDDDDDENRCDFWSLYYTNLNEDRPIPSATKM